ncbi:MAG: hypothetical protein K0V04_12970, partial [Deltaproteobacteria bacterium]|nr:hypothetical protein [Deltaproteobacteria bacterium]
GMDADAEALTVARRCIRVREDSPACWWTVAVLEEARHGTVEAREGYTMYLEHAPQGVHAVDARTSLQRLAATSTAGPAQAVAELDAHDHRVTAKPPL